MVRKKRTEVPSFFLAPCANFLFHLHVNTKGSSRRLTFSNGFASDFRVPVPEAFAEALRKEELSQGDIFYSSRAAYDREPWGNVLRKTEWAIQIRESMTGGKTVLFERMRRNAAMTAFVHDGTFKLHWDDFLARLRAGNFDDLEDLGI